MNTAEKLRKTFKECEEDNTVPHNRCSYQISYWASKRELRGYLKALDDVDEIFRKFRSLVREYCWVEEGEKKILMNTINGELLNKIKKLRG